MSACSTEDHRQPRIIDLNARFGGGYPLCHAAGAQFTIWILQGVLQIRREPLGDAFVDGLLMLRYDAATFVTPP